MEFFDQWNKRPETEKQAVSLPSCTVPDQTMTIQEIIAKFTRTGLVPQSFVRKDEGGNDAFEPGFDPLDSAQEVLTEAKASAGSGKDPSGDPSPEPESSAPEGKGGE